MAIRSIFGDRFREFGILYANRKLPAEIRQTNLMRGEVSNHQEMSRPSQTLVSDPLQEAKE